MLDLKITFKLFVYILNEREQILRKTMSIKYLMQVTFYSILLINLKSLLIIINNWLLKN